jgi:hypothetical protein
MPEEEQHAFEIRDARHALIVDERFRWSDPQAPGRERTGRIRGVLSVSEADHAVVDLSVRRAFVIGAGREALPAWAGFLEGVLECDELTPNAARDGVRQDAALIAARHALAQYVAREIPAAAARPENERLLRTVVTYLTNGSGFAHYVTEAESARLYRLLAEPRGIRVLDCSGESAGEEFLRRCAEISPERVRLNRLDESDSGPDQLFEPLDAPEIKQFGPLVRAFECEFVRARASRFEPAELPVVLLESPTLHLNAANPIIRRLAARPDLEDEVSRAALRSLHGNALILRAGAPSADAAQSTFAEFNRVIGLMLELAEARQADPAPARRPQPGYLSCAVTLPEGEPRSEEIFAAVRSVLEDGPYYWQVRRADSPPHGSELPLDLDEPPAGAALHIAVFAGPRLNQWLLNEISIGQILGLPQLILIDEAHPELPPSFADVPRSTVRRSGDVLHGEVLAALAGHPEVGRVRACERYLSPSILARLAGLDEAAGTAVSARYPTWPEFLAADAQDVARLAGIDVASVQAVRAGLRLLR